jgi:hypothetical protein
MIIFGFCGLPIFPWQGKATLAKQDDFSKQILEERKCTEDK